MKTISIKKGFSFLLLLEAAVICLVTIALMLNLYYVYIDLVYNESEEVLSLYTLMAENKLAHIENISFEILSNSDIQRNLLLYNNSGNLYDQYIASNNLYTQLFTRWVMDRNLASIKFVFPDGKQIDTPQRRKIDISDTETAALFETAYKAGGRCVWTINVAGRNTITLHRLINDISGKGFKSQGVLLITIDATYLFESAALRSRYDPEIVAVAGGQILYKEPPSLSSKEILNQVESLNGYSIVPKNRGQFLTFALQSEFNGWKFLYIIPKYILLNDINNIYILYAGIFLSIVSMIIFVGLKMADSISKPIAKLAQAMQKAENANYSTESLSLLPQASIIITEVQELSNDFLNMITKIDRLINEDYAKQLLILDMKCRLLQQQINPHFLYNVLDTINWKSIESGNKEISIMVQSLSKLLRNSIRLPDVVSIKDDIKIVEDYITIQKIRFEERLRFTSEVSAEFFTCRIPRLTLQPIVENCIVHNLEKYSRPCEINITSSISEDVLEICVSDNGCGIDLNIIEKITSGHEVSSSMSIGLKNVHERIKIFFGEKFGIHAENRNPTGTNIIIRLPYTRRL